MLIGVYFDGDDDAEAALKQRDVYGVALGIIVRTCNIFALRARALLPDTDHSDWGNVDRFDHRTLEGAHDLLAAVWRFRHDARQFQLFVEVRHPRWCRPLIHPGSTVRPHDPLGEVPGRWLGWLCEEVEGWMHLPHLVRWVQLALANQNEPAGYVAESELSIALIGRFEDVPWRPEWRAAIEEDLDKYRAGLE